MPNFSVANEDKNPEFVNLPRAGGGDPDFGGILIVKKTEIAQVRDRLDGVAVSLVMLR